MRMWRSSRTRSKRRSPLSSSRSGRSRTSWRRSSFSSGPRASPLLTAPASGQQASRPSSPDTVRPSLVASQPADPPGWERIHEGSFLEAVLLTQLSGDFPGPVLAMVSVPFYSADRQRVLIPRGARVVGTAQAVQDQDQSRLAVAFHRLLLPDGSWIDLEFTGLNQAGEGALQGPSRSPLLQHVRGRRSRRCRERTRLGRRLAVRPEGGRRPGPRPERDLGSRPVFEPAPHDHDPRGPSPAHLVHLRCPGP